MWNSFDGAKIDNDDRMKYLVRRHLGIAPSRKCAGIAGSRLPATVTPTAAAATQDLDET